MKTDGRAWGQMEDKGKRSFFVLSQDPGKLERTQPLPSHTGSSPRLLTQQHYFYCMRCHTPPRTPHHAA